MCGVGGIWKRRGGRAEHAELRRMMSAMHHRGPEGAAFGRMDGGALLLGFLRLGFTAGGTCQQPLYNEDGSIGLVYNGEIYDYEAMRAELEAQGHVFRTTSDTEVIVHLYEQHGDAAFDRLNGEFSFAIWDGRKEELAFVRDRFGVKPMLLAWRGDDLLFASEAKGLHAIPGVTAELDPLFYTGPGIGLAECARTPFRGVRSVRPGHVLRVTRTSVVETPWWRPTFDGQVGRAQRTLDDAAAEVRATLRRSVARRMAEGTVPIGLSLSSGIDSTILCGLMADDARAHGRDLRTFSVGYDDAPYDESAAAARTAKHFGAKHERVTCTAASLADGFLASIHSTEVATSSLSTTARMALTAAVRRAGLKALMSGEGSDELFGGYPYFTLEAIWRLREADRARGDRAFRRFASREASSRGVFWDELAPSAYARRVERASTHARWMFSRDWRRRMGDATPRATAAAELDPVWLARLAPFDASRAVARSVLGSLVIPALGDRVEMSSSLEGRVPYLDRDMIRLAYSLGENMCVDPARERGKYVLRRAFDGYLPPAFAPPPKHIRMAPSFADLARTRPGRALLAPLLDDGAIRRAGIFDPTFVRLLNRAFAWMPARGRFFESRQARLDFVYGYVASTQALHAVHVEDALGHRRALRDPALALDEERSPS